MRRETETELKARMSRAEELVPRNRHARHVRSRDVYVVRGHSLRESDLEALVHYSPRFYRSIVFSRPLDEFRAKFVQVNGDPWSGSMVE